MVKEKVTGITINMPVAGIPIVGFRLALVNETEESTTKIYERGIKCNADEVALFFQTFAMQEEPFMQFVAAIGKATPLDGN